GFGRVVTSTNRLNLQTSTTRDACGRATDQSAPYTPGVTGTIRYTHTQYDALGRVVSVTAPDNTVTVRNAYDGSNVTVTDAENHATLYTSKGFGAPTDARLTSVFDANGRTTSYTYDVYGHLTQVVGPGTAPARTWVYNGKGWLDHDTQPESGTTTYVYDNVGNVTRATD